VGGKGKQQTPTAHTALLLDSVRMTQESQDMASDIMGTLESQRRVLEENRDKVGTSTSTSRSSAGSGSSYGSSGFCLLQ